MVMAMMAMSFNWLEFNPFDMVSFMSMVFAFLWMGSLYHRGRCGRKGK